MLAQQVVPLGIRQALGAVAPAILTALGAWGAVVSLRPILDLPTGSMLATSGLFGLASYGALAWLDRHRLARAIAAFR
jgi:hypothetical protein